MSLLTLKFQYSSIKELLTLSRKIKELWVFGPLGQDDPDRRAKEEQIERDAPQAAQALDAMEVRRMVALAERCGGSWARLATDEVEGLAEGVVAAAAEAPK